MEGSQVVSFRGTRLPQFEVDFLQEIESIAHKEFVLKAEFNWSQQMGLKVENERIVKIGINNCGVRPIPESIGKLTELGTAYIGENNLTTLPEALRNLKKLKTLDISYNQFTQFPTQLYSLDSLEVLDMYNNPLVELPESIDGLKQIKRLLLRQNKISYLPKSIVNIKSLTELSLEECTLFDKEDPQNNPIIQELQKKSIKITFPAHVEKDKIPKKAQSIQPIYQPIPHPTPKLSITVKSEAEKQQLLRELFKNTESVKINELSSILGTNRSDLLRKFIDWRKKFEFKIDGDYVKIPLKDVENFINTTKSQVFEIKPETKIPELKKDDVKGEPDKWAVNIRCDGLYKAANPNYKEYIKFYPDRTYLYFGSKETNLETIFNTFTPSSNVQKGTFKMEDYKFQGSTFITSNSETIWEGTIEGDTLNLRFYSTNKKELYTDKFIFQKVASSQPLYIKQEKGEKIGEPRIDKILAGK